MYNMLSYLIFLGDYSMKKFIIFLVAVMISCEVSCFAKTYLDTNLPLAGETLYL